MLLLYVVDSIFLLHKELLELSKLICDLHNQVANLNAQKADWPL